MFRCRRLYNYTGLTGGQIIHKKLDEYGIEYVPSYAGGASLPIIDAFYKSEKPKIIDICTEQEGGFIAMGYAKTLMDRPGCVISTSGPGLSNLVTPIIDSACDHVPLIVISGQVATNYIGKDAFQECKSLELLQPYVKYAKQVTNINELPSIMDFAKKCAMHGEKGVVFLDIPKDISLAKLTNETKYIPPFELCDFEYIYAENEMQKIASLINNADNPILYVGQGAKECYKELRHLAKKGNIPVCTTLHGMGIFDETDNLALKMVGQHGSVVANMAVQKSDMIICIGARFDDRTIGNESKYALNAKRAYNEGRGGIVHFNINNSQFGKNVKSHYNYLGDCKKYINILEKYINHKKRKEWINYINAIKQKYPYQMTYNAKYITIENILDKLNSKIKNKNFYLSTGVGGHQMFSTMWLTWRKPNRILTSGSQGVMGSGLGYIIGSYFANKTLGKDNMYICINGDASFNMEMGTLQTISHYNLPIKLFIMNDKRAQMVYVWQELFFNKKIIGTHSRNPNYKKLAESWNLPYFECKTHEDINKLMTKINEKGPLIIDCKVNPSICLPLVKPGCGLDEILMYKDGIYNGELNEALNKSDVPS